jgi:hypothetical protein
MYNFDQLGDAEKILGGIKRVLAGSQAYLDIQQPISIRSKT